MARPPALAVGLAGSGGGTRFSVRAAEYWWARTSNRTQRKRVLIAASSRCPYGKTHSRPHVSNDNPYSEAQFKTLKYQPDYPERFGCQQDARSWAKDFFDWYDYEHHHSALGLPTPADVHYGRAQAVIQQRQQVLQAAYQKNPARFVKGLPKPPQLPDAVWINPPKPVLRQEKTLSLSS